jgi:hypothetical protein
MAIDINLTSQVSQSITNGVTDKAPSEDAVFDAMALKIPVCPFITTTTVSHTGSTSETVIYSSPNCAGKFQAGDVVRILMQYAASSNANNKNFKVYVSDSPTAVSGGGVTSFVLGITPTITTNNATQRGWVRNLQIIGLTNSKILLNTTTVDTDEGQVSNNGGMSNTAFDFDGASVYFHVTCTLANSSDTGTLRHFRGQILR